MFSDTETMNGITAAKSNVSHFPNNVSILTADEVESRPTWFQSRLIDAGIYAMADKNTPQGFYVNYSTVLFYLTVIGTILGGFYWTYERGRQAGFERGVDQQKYEEMNERLKKAEDEAKKAKDFGLVNFADKDKDKDKKENK